MARRARAAAVRPNIVRRVRHNDPRFHRSYCPACRVEYYRNYPGPQVTVIDTPQGRRYGPGRPPTLSHLAARAVGARNLFRYPAPRHTA